MDYETLNVLYLSRKTLLTILTARGYDTTPYEKFGPIEISAMAAASTGAAGAGAFRMDLQRATAVDGITKCRVEYSINRVKNRISGFLSGILGEDVEDGVDRNTTELLVVVLEPVVEAFHTAAMTFLAQKARISFFQAHTIVNNPMDHVLVPKHELLPPSEHTEFLTKHKIKTKANLPLIKFHEDMIARVMGLQPGDIVKITRPSPSAGEYISYRLCVP